MEESALALVLKECLDAMERGGEPVDIAARYPEQRAEIIPLLELAAELRETAAAPPVPFEFLNDLSKRLTRTQPGA